MGIFLMDLVV